MVKNKTKKALTLSIIAMILCVAMLAGTTFAWFTDSATSAQNTIISGNLDVILEYATWDSNTGTWSSYQTVTESTKVFNENALYEPGYTEVVKFKVTNAGSLALKYSMSEMVYTETPGTNVLGDSFKLSDYLYTGLLTNANAIDSMSEADARAEVVAAASQKLSAGYAMKTDIPLESGQSDEMILVLTMPTTVGNEANHASGTQPSIQLGISLVATQYAFESDDFGNQYDKDATYPVNISISKPVSVDSTGGTPVVAAEIEITHSDSTGSVSQMTVTVPVNTELAAGTTELTYVVQETAVNPNIVITSAQTAKTFEVDVQGLSDTNGVAVTHTWFIEKGLTGVEMYHESTPLVCNYNPVTGELVFSTPTHSPFTIVYKKNSGEIETAADLETVIANGGVAILAKDIVLANNSYLTIPNNGKTVTIDLNGYTLSGINDKNTTSYLIKVEAGADLVIKNGTVSFLATTPDVDWSSETDPPFPTYANNTINCVGRLTVENATIINETTPGGASYAIDCYPGADVTIEKGSVIDGDDKVAIRMFANSGTVATNLTVNGGLITGRRAVWVQLPSNNPDVVPPVNLTVNGGTLQSTDPTYHLAIYVYSYGNSFAGTNIAFNGGVINSDVALGGGGVGASANVTEKVGLETVTFSPNCVINSDVYRYTMGDEEYLYTDGYVYDPIELAAALKAGKTAVLMDNITLEANESFTIPAGVVSTLDFNGYTITATHDSTTGYGTFNISQGATLTVKGNGGVNLTTNVTTGISACIFQNDGTLNIEGGNFVANQPNSVSGLGAVIAIVDNCTNGANSTVNIYNGTFQITGLGAINMFRNWPMNNSIATLNIYGGTFNSNTQVKTTYIWSKNDTNLGPAQSYVNITGGTFVGNFVVEVDGYKENINVADGITLDVIPGSFNGFVTKP